MNKAENLAGDRFAAGLRELWSRPDPWNYDHGPGLFELQFALLRGRFAEGRSRLKVLDQRARDEGVERIDSLDDVIKLLFSHTTYKSYPTSFLQKGRWDMMNRWLGTLSTCPVTNVDLAGVTGVDTWIPALHKAGHLVMSSSGTTGLSSYVNRTPADHEWTRQMNILSTRIACGQDAERIFPYFWGGPEIGWNAAGQHNKVVRETYGKEGECFAVSKEDISIADLDRLAMTRKAVIDGTATPEMIRTAESEGERRMADMERNIQVFFDRLFAYRDRPIYLFAGMSMLWRIVEAGRARGLKDGAFHPGTIVRTGGGKKGFKGPDNFQVDAQRFFGITPDRWLSFYGMTELNSLFYLCSEGRYHCPPTAIPLILDKSGERLVNTPRGIVEGRGGFFDLTLEGHWGGVISGDRLKVDFDPCPCGRKSPSVIEVARYKDLAEGDDKLTCAGQIDSYVRGFTSEESTA